MHSRRQFILKGAKLVAAGAAAAAAGPSVFVRGAAAAGKTLKLLQWAHFVPAYDKWLDPWAKDWGSKRGVEVTVDHVGFADVVPRATAEVAAQSGHDVHMFIGLASAFEERVVDLKDVSANLEKKYGKPVELAHRSTYNAFTKKQFTLSDMWVPDPGNFHKKVWTDIGMPSGPSTYVHGAVLHVAADGLPQDVAEGGRGVGHGRRLQPARRRRPGGATAGRVALVRGDVYYWGSLMAACLITSVPSRSCTTSSWIGFIAGFTVGAIK
ncbi:MAG TPA: hypothetical protein VIG37_23675 [Methylomirabilota bacterium]|jgi:hypothetical protein